MSSGKRGGYGLPGTDLPRSSTIDLDECPGGWPLELGEAGLPAVAGRLGGRTPKDPVTRFPMIGERATGDIALCTDTEST